MGFHRFLVEGPAECLGGNGGIVEFLHLFPLVRRFVGPQVVEELISALCPLSHTSIAGVFRGHAIGVIDLVFADLLVVHAFDTPGDEVLQLLVVEHQVEEHHGAFRILGGARNDEHGVGEVAGHGVTGQSLVGINLNDLIAKLGFHFLVLAGLELLCPHEGLLCLFHGHAILQGGHVFVDVALLEPVAGKCLNSLILFRFLGVEDLDVSIGLDEAYIAVDAGRVVHHEVRGLVALGGNEGDDVGFVFLDGLEEGFEVGRGLHTGEVHVVLFRHGLVDQDAAHTEHVLVGRDAVQYAIDAGGFQIGGMDVRDDVLAIIGKQVVEFQVRLLGDIGFIVPPLRAEHGVDGFAGSKRQFLLVRVAVPPEVVQLDGGVDFFRQELADFRLHQFNVLDLGGQEPCVEFYRLQTGFRRGSRFTGSSSRFRRLRRCGRARSGAGGRSGRAAARQQDCQGHENSKQLAHAFCGFSHFRFLLFD